MDKYEAEQSITIRLDETNVLFPLTQPTPQKGAADPKNVSKKKLIIFIVLFFLLLIGFLRHFYIEFTLFNFKEINFFL